MRIIRTVLMALVAVSLTGCGFLRDIVHMPLRRLMPVVVHTTAHDIALAMQEDRFYSDYGPDMLIVQGSVASVNQAHNSTIIEFTTGIATTALCDLRSGTAPEISTGTMITVTAPAVAAERQPSAVMLRLCKVVTGSAK